MEILIVSATHDEVKPTFEFCKSRWIPNDNGSYTLGQATVHFLITGAGMFRMAYALGQTLAHTSPDICINAGIAGTFPGKLSIGDVVHVVSESMADLGAEDRNGDFLTLKDMGLQEDLQSSLLENTQAGNFSFLPTANGITVNTTSGTRDTISELMQRYDADTESMEGAAFFYCCLKQGVQFIQLRAVSNIIEPRDKTQWQIPMAIEKLNKQLVEMLQLLSV